MATERRCGAKNAKGKPCGMKPLRGRDHCLAHDKKAKKQADAARVAGGERRGKQQQRAAAAKEAVVELPPPPPPDWRQLDTVADVEAAIAFSTKAVIDGEMGAREGAAAARLLVLARDAAERRDRERLRAAAPKRRTPTGKIDGTAALNNAVRSLTEALERVKADPGLTEEQRSAQVAVLAGALTKAADPAGLIQELTAQLRAALAALSSVQESDGVQEPKTGPGGTKKPPR